mmetsp:Transcript_3502/g.6629  ORF Transcript_3502/g.6629 Transcript_3502/m.6629 type:complete len:559 (+) Transcript_3502:51-1727(+)
MDHSNQHHPLPPQSQSSSSTTKVPLSNVKDEQTRSLTGVGLGVGAPSSHIMYMDDDSNILSNLLGNEQDTHTDTHADVSMYEDMELGNILSDQEDEIIREIDVYISPELAKTMYLIQFPLQPASHAIHPLEMKLGDQNGKQGKRTAMKSPVPPVPKAAKIKPQHSILELTYDVPNSSFSNQRQIPGPLNLTERTFASQNIPIKTHMALGLFDNTNNKIDLVPLKSIIQMRPTFRHVDALYDGGSSSSTMGDGLEEDEEMDGSTDKEKATSKPVMFQKSENERTILARKSSYAYKKASEEAEEWIELDVHGPGSDKRKTIMKRAYCPREDRERHLRFLKAGKRGGITGYVKSLNYLPNATDEEAVEDFVAGFESVVMSQDRNSLQQPEWMKELAARVSTLLQKRQGVTVSYSVIRSRFHPSISDHALIQALSASASLVRGNFVMKSSLMPLSPPVAKARDVILILMIKYGIVQRHLLLSAFEKSGEESVVITAHVINSLLEMIARKTINGMEMNLEDDMTFETDFHAIARLHEMYWDKREKELKRYIDLYELEMKNASN